VCVKGTKNLQWVHSNGGYESDRVRGLQFGVGVGDSCSAWQNDVASEAGPTNTEQHPREKDCFLHAEPIVENPLGKSARDKTSARTWRRLAIALE
jgi:hypothetical protein